MPYVRKSKKSMVKRVKKVRKTKVPKSIKTYVSKAIHKQLENKRGEPFTVVNQGIVPYGGVTATSGTVHDLTNALEISQGTGQGNRVGDRVRATYFGVRGVVTARIPVGTTPDSAPPAFLKVYVGRLKSSVLAPTDFTTLFQAGNSSAAPLNQPIDMLGEINTDVYTIYKSKMFKLAPASVNNPTTGAFYYDNNDYKLTGFFNFNLTKHLKSVIYNDTSTQPSNCGFFMWFTMAYADGSTITPTGTDPDFPNLVLSLETKFHYEDA